MITTIGKLRIARRLREDASFRAWRKRALASPVEGNAFIPIEIPNQRRK